MIDILTRDVDADGVEAKYIREAVGACSSDELKRTFLKGYLEGVRSSGDLPERPDATREHYIFISHIGMRFNPRRTECLLELTSKLGMDEYTALLRKWAEKNEEMYEEQSRGSA